MVVCGLNTGNQCYLEYADFPTFSLFFFFNYVMQYSIN